MARQTELPGRCPLHQEILTEAGRCPVEWCRYRPDQGYPPGHVPWGKRGGGIKGAPARARRKSAARLKMEQSLRRGLAGMHARTIPLEPRRPRPN